MIVTTPFQAQSEEYKHWFLGIRDEGLAPDEPFDPSTAFDYYGGEDEEGEHTYTISGSTFGINPDGSLTRSFVILTEDGPQAISNIDLRYLLKDVFPDIVMDPESDQFFAYAETEEDAQLLTGLLNHPEEFVRLIEDL